VVVLGHDREALHQALGDLPVQRVLNPDYRRGQGSSISAGVKALPARVDAAIVGVADQPFVAPGLLRAEIELYRARGARIVAPRYAGVRASPALFDRTLFSDLLAPEADVGGRYVIAEHPEEVAWLDVADGVMALDVDTPEDYRKVLEQYGNDT